MPTFISIGSLLGFIKRSAARLPSGFPASDGD